MYAVEDMAHERQLLHRWGDVELNAVTNNESWRRLIKRMHAMRYLE